MGDNQKTLCIVGAGGFGREVYAAFKDVLPENESGHRAVFFDEKPELQGKTLMGIPVISGKDFDPARYEVVIAVGEPGTRKKIAESLPKETRYATLIHPSAIVMDDVEIGEGSIVTAGCILTCNIRMGKHAHLNLHTTVGHDCSIGDYFTTAPGVHISGECILGHCVYFGTNASVRQGIRIADETTIGMGGVVVKNIDDRGVYIGNPLKKLEK